MIIQKTIEKVLCEFNDKNINYCHFKSNEDIEKDLSGESDFDIILDISQKELIHKILLKNGFFKTTLVDFKRLNNIDDYFAIDDISGLLVHFHAHFNISFNKYFHFSFEKEILNSRITLEKYNTFGTNPCYDLILRILKLAIKNKQFDNKIENKLIAINKLIKNIDQKIEDILDLHLNKKIKNIIMEIYKNNISKENYYLINNLSKELSIFQVNNSVITTKNKINEITKKIFNKLNTKLNILKSINNHRKLSSNGIIISITGSDGSGKSTQVKNLTNLFKNKIDTRYVYMGSGNGPSSWHRSILNILKKILIKKKMSTLETSNPQNSKKKKKESFIKKIFKIIYAVSLAIEKRSKLKYIKKCKENGMIIITDRYPQTQTFGYNDGPLIAEYLESKNSILKLISEYEYNSYKLAEFIYPDIAIKLIGDPLIIYKRRSDEMTLEQIIFKQNGVRNIQFSKYSLVKEVNATLPIKDVSIIITNHINRVIISNG